LIIFTGVNPLPKIPRHSYRDLIDQTDLCEYNIYKIFKIFISILLYMDNSYYQKYIKYKNKYINLKMLIQTEGGNSTTGKGDRRQNQNREIYENIKKTHQETYISPEEKEQEILYKKKENDNTHVPTNGPRLSYMSELVDIELKKIELSDHNPFVYNEMMFWNIQRQEDITKAGTPKEIESNRRERYRKIITRINKLVRENTNITVIGLQECHKSLQIDGFFHVNFAPKASTIIKGGWEKEDVYGNSLFIKNELRSNITFGNHNYEKRLSKVDKDKLYTILGNRVATIDELNNGKRVTNYFNYVFTDKTLYVNIHGSPQYHDLNDLFTEILNINNKYETGTLQNIYIGGDFNKTSDMLHEKKLYYNVLKFSQLIKYFNYNGVIYSESTRDGKIIDHIIQFIVKT